MAQVKVKFNRGVEGATNIVDAGTEGTKVATGTTAQRGTTTGQWRYNTTTGFFEGRNASGSFSTLEPDPLITGISPTTQASANANIVISGTNFFTGSTVTFIGNDGTQYASPSVTVNSLTQITATTPSTALTAANEPYDVRVTSSTGKITTLNDALDAGGSPTWSTSAGNLGSIADSATGTHFTLSASDPDGTTIAYAETASVLSGAGLSLNSSNGQITGDPTDVNSSTTKTFTVNASAGGDTTARTFNIIITPSYNGSSSAKAAGSPAQIKSLNGGSNPSDGTYWYMNSGYNSGTPFQAFTTWGRGDNEGMMILNQFNINGVGNRTFSDCGTAYTGSATGTRGHNYTFKEPIYNILGNWSGDTGNKSTVFMYRYGGSAFSNASDMRWIQLSVNFGTFRNMFDNIPGVGEFTGTISARSVGGTGSFYWSKTSNEYNNHLQMGNQTGSNGGGWNQNNYMEFRQAGSDNNHGWFVDANGTAGYAVGSGLTYNRVGGYAISPTNVRT